MEDQKRPYEPPEVRTLGMLRAGRGGSACSDGSSEAFDCSAGSLAGQSCYSDGNNAGAGCFANGLAAAPG